MVSKCYCPEWQMFPTLNEVLLKTADILAFSWLARHGASNDRGSFTALISKTK
jgi:hypothetical protein